MIFHPQQRHQAGIASEMAIESDRDAEPSGASQENLAIKGLLVVGDTDGISGLQKHGLCNSHLGKSSLHVFRQKSQVLKQEAPRRESYFCHTDSWQQQPLW